MKKQWGFGLSQLISWGVILGLLAVLGMKVVPSFIEYQTIVKTVKKIGAESNPQTTVAQVKAAFIRQLQVDTITSITADDLDVYKDGNQVVISFAYSHKVKMFGPVSLLIDYEGTSKVAE